DVFTRLLQSLDAPAPQALYAGAIPIPTQLPGFARENVLDLLSPAIEAKIWLGNRVTVATHFDMSYNVACVVAGRRRFTLIPPDQLENMYVGPLEFTLAGPPVSMVRLEAPDFERYPRFRTAMAAAQFADLEPGDALFIPYMWWHHVESRDRFNVLVNYWWDDAPAWQSSPFWALMHGIHAVRNLSPEHREIWRRQFEHFVFSGGEEALAHLTESQRGIQGTPTAQKAQAIRNYVAQMLAGRR
ncbi:MAG TPA: cupin-like domain-containing protein, partial [Steroidobacteraceae bacterium]|nr:cupin-like domain-containing protein [Steroidobacteraceae bacterium]